MTNTQLHYIILRASTIADLCIDGAFYWDFHNDAEEIPDKIIAIMELLKRDLKDAASAVAALERKEASQQVRGVKCHNIISL
jgi:hypothetical protein